MPDGRRVRKNFQDKADALRELGDLELEVEGPASAERSEVRRPEPSDKARPKDHEASLRAEGPASARQAA